jgi:hypothetical protein
LDGLADLGAGPDDRVERGLRPIDLQRMAAGMENDGFDWGGRARLDGADLLERPVLVVDPLDQKRGGPPAPTVSSMFQAFRAVPRSNREKAAPACA